MTAAVAENFDMSISLAASFGEVLAAVPTADDEVDAAVERMDKAHRRAEREVAKNVELLNTLTQQLRCLVEDGAAIPLDDYIERCERTEGRLQREFKSANKTAGRIEKMLKHFIPRAAPLVSSRLRNLRKSMLAIQDEYQNVRWQLMAVRASMNSDEKGPAFGQAADLKRHLAALLD